MTPSSNPDQALDELTSEFVEIPVRIVIDVFRSYLHRMDSVAAAAAATRARIIDACVAA
jgi:hypothetical protein